MNPTDTDLKNISFTNLLDRFTLWEAIRTGEIRLWKLVPPPKLNAKLSKHLGSDNPLGSDAIKYVYEAFRAIGDETLTPHEKSHLARTLLDKILYDFNQGLHAKHAMKSTIDYSIHSIFIKPHGDPLPIKAMDALLEFLAELAICTDRTEIQETHISNIVEPFRKILEDENKQKYEITYWRKYWQNCFIAGFLAKLAAASNLNAETTHIQLQEALMQLIKDIEIAGHETSLPGRRNGIGFEVTLGLINFVISYFEFKADIKCDKLRIELNKAFYQYRLACARHVRGDSIVDFCLDLQELSDCIASQLHGSAQQPEQEPISSLDTNPPKKSFSQRLIAAAIAIGRAVKRVYSAITTFFSNIMATDASNTNALFIFDAGPYPNNEEFSGKSKQRRCSTYRDISEATHVNLSDEQDSSTTSRTITPSSSSSDFLDLVVDHEEDNNSKVASVQLAMGSPVDSRSSSFTSQTEDENKTLLYGLEPGGP